MPCGKPCRLTRRRGRRASAGWRRKTSRPRPGSWRRIGPAQARPTQLDVWNESPPEGSGFLYVGQAGSDPGRIALGEGQGATLSFEVRFGGARLRDGTVTPFFRFLGLRPRLPWGTQYR